MAKSGRAAGSGGQLPEDASDWTSSQHASRVVSTAKINGGDRSCSAAARPLLFSPNLLSQNPSHILSSLACSFYY